MQHMVLRKFPWPSTTLHACMRKNPFRRAALLLSPLTTKRCACSLGPFRYGQNFDDANNWLQSVDGVAPVLSASPPATVTVGLGKREAEPIDIKVKDGNKFALGELEIAPGVTLSLDVDAEIVFDDAADGDDATFVGGQTTERAECSLGCQSNFYEYPGGVGQAAYQLPEPGAETDLELATRAPCADDSVVIPDGYNVNVLGMGFHVFKSVTYVNVDDVVEIENAALVPGTFFFDVVHERLAIGEQAEDACSDAGLYSDSKDHPGCICTSEWYVCEPAEARAGPHVHAASRFTQVC